MSEGNLVPHVGHVDLLPLKVIAHACMSCAGIRIFCSEQRSQGQNRERAMALLRSRLYEIELEKQRAAESAKRKTQVSSCSVCVCVCGIIVEKFPRAVTGSAH